MDIGELVLLITKALDEKPGNITADTTSDQVANWDSLGHIQILRMLDEQFDDVTMKSPALASSTSIKEIHSHLTEAGL